MLSPDRDVEKTRVTLEAWLAERMPEADGVTIPELIAPEGTGFSNETLVFDLAYREGGLEETRSLVARIQQPEQTIFPDLDVTRQARVMEAVARASDVPVPEVLWIENDSGVLGTPFYVMEKIEGTIPSDVPSYNEQGFLTELAPEVRRRLFESGIEQLARVHAIDWRGAGLGFLDRPEDGASGLDQILAYLERYRDWALAGRAYPIADEAWSWLTANRPTETGPTCLCWGDARPSNMIFGGNGCVGILDWEMAVVGSPEQDLAWWLYFDRFSAEGYGVERLDGLPTRDETVACYERASGAEPRDLTFFEVLAGFYFVLIMVRVADTLRSSGLLDEDSDFATNNTSTELLTTVLEEVS